MSAQGPGPDFDITKVRESNIYEVYSQRSFLFFKVVISSIISSVYSSIPIKPVGPGVDLVVGKLQDSNSDIIYSSNTVSAFVALISVVSSVVYSSTASLITHAYNVLLSSAIVPVYTSSQYVAFVQSLSNIISIGYNNIPVLNVIKNMSKIITVTSRAFTRVSFIEILNELVGEIYSHTIITSFVRTINVVYAMIGSVSTRSSFTELISSVITIRNRTNLQPFQVMSEVVYPVEATVHKLFARKHISHTIGVIGNLQTRSNLVEYIDETVSVVYNAITSTLFYKLITENMSVPVSVSTTTSFVEVIQSVVSVSALTGFKSNQVIIEILSPVEAMIEHLHASKLIHETVTQFDNSINRVSNVIFEQLNVIGNEYNIASFVETITERMGIVYNVITNPSFLNTITLSSLIQNRHSIILSSRKMIESIITLRDRTNLKALRVILETVGSLDISIGRIHAVKSLSEIERVIYNIATVSSFYKTVTQIQSVFTTVSLPASFIERITLLVSTSARTNLAPTQIIVESVHAIDAVVEHLAVLKILSENVDVLSNRISKNTKSIVSNTGIISLFNTYISNIRVLVETVSSSNINTFSVFKLLDEHITTSYNEYIVVSIAINSVDSVIENIQEILYGFISLSTVDSLHNQSNVSVSKVIRDVVSITHSIFNKFKGAPPGVDLVVGKMQESNSDLVYSESFTPIKTQHLNVNVIRSRSVGVFKELNEFIDSIPSINISSLLYEIITSGVSMPSSNIISPHKRIDATISVLYLIGSPISRVIQITENVVDTVFISTLRRRTKSLSSVQSTVYSSVTFPSIIMENVASVIPSLNNVKTYIFFISQTVDVNYNLSTTRVLFQTVTEVVGVIESISFIRTLIKIIDEIVIIEYRISFIASRIIYEIVDHIYTVNAIKILRVVLDEATQIITATIIKIKIFGKKAINIAQYEEFGEYESVQEFVLDIIRNND